MSVHRAMRSLKLNGRETMIKVGDTVTWYSQANGSTTFKAGIVVKFVPPGQSLPELLDELDAGTYNTSKLRRGTGARRAKISYLVAVSTTGGSKPIVYWPVVERLQVVPAFATL